MSVRMAHQRETMSAQRNQRREMMSVRMAHQRETMSAQMAHQREMMRNLMDHRRETMSARMAHRREMMSAQRNQRRERMGARMAHRGGGCWISLTSLRSSTWGRPRCLSRTAKDPNLPPPRRVDPVPRISRVYRTANRVRRWI